MFKSILCILSLILVTSCMQVKLKDELEFNGQDSSASDSPDSEESSESYETQFIGSRSMNVRYGDYKFMSNFLKSNFGQDCNTVINTNILNRPEVFGAVCDHYDRTETCNDLKISNPLVLTSTMRAGRVMKTCEEIVARSACVNYFLTKSGLSRASEINDKNLLRAYKQFYPLEEDINEEQKAAFRKLASHFPNKIDQWKAVELALCMSPEWQIP